MSGSGAGGGFDFQSRVSAFVAAFILARRELRWTPVVGGDIPTVISAETGGSGDDLRIDLKDSSVVYESQSKRGLSADVRLDDSLGSFAKGMLLRPEERGILVVEPRSSRPIKEELHDALERRRQGVVFEPKGSLKRALEVLKKFGAETIAGRLYVQMVDVEDDASDGVQNALTLLQLILDDPDQAGAAWAVLITDGLRLIRQGGRRDYDALVAILGRENIHIVGSRAGSGFAFERLNSELEQIKLSLPRGLFPLSATQPSAEVDKLSIELDVAKQMLDDGNPRSALELLNKLSNKVAGATVSARVRLYNLRAVAFLHLDELLSARAQLGSALELAPDDLIALSNAAQTELRIGEDQKALDFAMRVINRDPSRRAAWSVLVQLRPTTIVPTELADTPELLTARALVELEAGRLDDGIELLRRATAEEFSAERTLVLAEALHRRAIERGETGRYRTDVLDARLLLDQVLDALTSRNEPILTLRALVARGNVAEFVGDLTAATADFAAAGAQDPGSPRAVYLVALSHYLAAEPQKALYATEGVALEQMSPMLLILRARSLLVLGRNSEVLDTLKRAAAVNVGSNSTSGLPLAIAEVALQAGFVELAEEQLVAPTGGDRWLEDLCRARIAVRRGIVTLAIERYESAIAGAMGGARIEVQAEYAEYLRQLGKAREAITVLEAADAAADEGLRPLYARALFEAKELTKSANLLDRMSKESVILPIWALQLGAQVAHLTDDVPGLITYLSRLLVESEDNIEYAIRLAHAHLRNRDLVHAHEVLDSVRERGNAAPRQLLAIADLCIRAGQAHLALPLAYRALRAEPDAADIQLAYVNLFHRRADDERLDVTTVAVDTFVMLRTERGDSIGYFIVSDAPRQLANELAADEGLARGLIGKCVGDTIVLRAGAASETRTTITEIKSHLVHTYQDILEHFPERHPENVALQSFKVPDNPTAQDFKFLVEAVKTKHETTNEILEEYVRRGGIPLGMVASLLRTDIPHAYQLLVNDNTRSLLVEFGDGDPRVLAEPKSGMPVIVTRSALLTVDRLEMSRLLEATYSQLVVPRSLLDELEEQRQELINDAEKGREAVAYDGRAPILVSAPAEVFRVRVKRLETVIDWVYEHCDIRPRPLVNISQEDEQLREIIGASSFDSLVLAQEAGAEIYADDLGIRRLLLGRCSRYGFSTYGFVLAAQAVGHLLTDGAERLIAQLIRLRHEPLGLTPGVLREMFVVNGYQLDGRTMQLIDRLRDTELPVGNVIGFCANTLRQVATAPEGPRNLSRVSYTLLEAATADRELGIVLPLFERLIKAKLQLLPVELDCVMETLERYVHFKVLGQPALLPVSG